jgi:hypothetical protein
MPLEGSIIPVVFGMLRKGTANHAMAPGVDPELLATTVGWAIFGARSPVVPDAKPNSCWADGYQD